MPRRTQYAPGTFCWVDLATSDLDAAAGFYGQLFGWTTEEMPGGNYRLFRRDGAAVAGLAELQPEQAQAGVPPHWSTYVRVESADETAARAQQRGGTVLAGPFDIDGSGRMAVLADPQGAVISLWQPAGFAGAEVVNEVGAWTWNDLVTLDPDAASAFYRDLFGWTIEDAPGSGGQYRTIRNGDAMIGGMLPAPPDVQRPFWNVYFGVDDVDAALEHVEAAGGGRIVAPIDVPAGRFAVVRDPLGAAFSVFQGQFDD